MTNESTKKLENSTLKRYLPFYLVVLGAILGIAYFNTNKPAYYPPIPTPVNRPVSVDSYKRYDGTEVSSYDRAPPGQKERYDRTDSYRTELWMQNMDIVAERRNKVRLQAWLVFLGFAISGCLILWRRHRKMLGFFKKRNEQTEMEEFVKEMVKADSYRSNLGRLTHEELYKIKEKFYFVKTNIIFTRSLQKVKIDYRWLKELEKDLIQVNGVDILGMDEIRFNILKELREDVPKFKQEALARFKQEVLAKSEKMKKNEL